MDLKEIPIEGFLLFILGKLYLSLGNNGKVSVMTAKYMVNMVLYKIIMF